MTTPEDDPLTPPMPTPPIPASAASRNFTSTRVSRSTNRQHSAATVKPARCATFSASCGWPSHADGGALALRVYVHPLEENKRRAAAHLDRIIGSQG